MKTIKKIFLGTLLVLSSPLINAQEIDQRCVKKYNGTISLDTNEVPLYINTQNAKTENGDIHTVIGITVKATLKKYDRARLIITQQGTWFKGIEFYKLNPQAGSITIQTIAPPKKTYHSSFPTTTATTTTTTESSDFGNYLSACTRDEFKIGSTYIRDMKGMGAVFLAEAKFLGKYTTVRKITNFRDLDDKYDWTIHWNE